MFNSPAQMRYPLVEIEISQPLPDLCLEAGDAGLALLLRYKDRPVGFVMKPVPAERRVSAQELLRWIAPWVGAGLIEAVQAETSGQTKPVGPFPTLTIAICTKDRPEYLQRCLSAILALPELVAGEPGIEVLVMDNAPSDQRTQDLVAGLPVRYVRELKPGLDFARNRAIQEATGEWLAYIDDDVVVDRQWLAGLREAWSENPDAGGVTGLVLPYELNSQAQILFERRGGFRRGFQKVRYGQTRPQQRFYPCTPGIFGTGANMVLRRELLLKLKGFDEALDTGNPLPGGGDLDIFYRIIRAGYPLVYEPRCAVFHQHRIEYKRLRHQYWTWGLTYMAFIVKSWQLDPPMRPRLVQVTIWWLLLETRELLRSLIGRYVLPPDMVWAELWGSIIGLLGAYSRSVQRIEQIHRQYSNPEMTTEQ